MFHDPAFNFGMLEIYCACYSLAKAWQPDCPRADLNAFVSSCSLYVLVRVLDFFLVYFLSMKYLYLMS